MLAFSVAQLIRDLGCFPLRANSKQDAVLVFRWKRCASPWADIRFLRLMRKRLAKSELCRQVTANKLESTFLSGTKLTPTEQAGWQGAN